MEFEKKKKIKKNFFFSQEIFLFNKLNCRLREKLNVNRFEILETTHCEL